MKVLFTRACVLFAIVLLAAVGVWLGQKIGSDPGYVLFAFNGVSIETSLWFFIIVVVALAIVVYVMLWLVHCLLTSKNVFSHWLINRSHQQAIEKTNDGLLSLMAGLWKEAQQLLLKAAPAAESPVLNYVAAARAAEHLGDTQACDEALLKAENVSNRSFVVLLARADILLKRGDIAQAGYELEQLYQRHPKHVLVLNLLQQAYYQDGAWAKLNKLLPVLRKQKLLAELELSALERKVAQQLLGFIAHSNEVDAKKLAMLDDIWRSLSNSQIHDPHVIAVYAKCLMELHADHDAEVILKDCLKKQWNEACVRLMAELSGGDVNDRLLVAERWLRDHPHDPVLLLTLGRLCLRNQLWGKARTYFQESLHLMHSAETYAELGRLCASLSEDELSASYFRQGLLLAQPLPNLPMPLLDNHKVSPHLR